MDCPRIKNSLRFGVEIEINAFDNKSRPDSSCELPIGSENVALILNDVLKEKVMLSGWQNNHYNNLWFVKPDSSCGIEICSPILKGVQDIEKVSKLIGALKKNNIKSDERCSFHVHIDVSNFSHKDIVSIISWWIKLEAFFVDMVSFNRKCNHFCKLIAQSNIIKNVSKKYSFSYFLSNLGRSKYFTLNTHHYYKSKRKTIEFRVIDSSVCLSERDSFNWLYLLIHFVECSLCRGIPPKYKRGDPFTGYCWLDPIDAFNFLNFTPKAEAGTSNIAKWTLDKLLENGNNFLVHGIFSSEYRMKSYKDICKMEKIFI